MEAHDSFQRTRHDVRATPPDEIENLSKKLECSESIKIKYQNIFKISEYDQKMNT